MTGQSNILNPQRVRELYLLHIPLAQVFGDDDAMRRLVALFPMLPPLPPPGKGKTGRRKRGRPTGSIADKAVFQDMALLCLAEVVRDSFRTPEGDRLSEHAIATIIIEDIFKNAGRVRRNLNPRLNKAKINALAKRLELARKRAVRSRVQFLWPPRAWRPNTLWDIIHQRLLTASLSGKRIKFRISATGQLK